MFNNKKDVLLESVKKVMQESELHRRLETELNEAFGITSRAALPRESVAEYDAMLAEAKKNLSHDQSKLAALGTVAMGKGDKKKIDKHDLDAARKGHANKVGLGKKAVNEGIESIHEEIRNTLWEKLDHIYENHGEDAAMEMYASLTEEEQAILSEMDVDPTAKKLPPTEKAGVSQPTGDGGTTLRGPERALAIGQSKGIGSQSVTPQGAAQAQADLKPSSTPSLGNNTAGGADEWQGVKQAPGTHLPQSKPQPTSSSPSPTAAKEPVLGKNIVDRNRGGGEFGMPKPKAGPVSAAKPGVGDDPSSFKPSAARTAAVTGRPAPPPTAKPAPASGSTQQYTPAEKSTGPSGTARPAGAPTPAARTAGTAPAAGASRPGMPARPAAARPAASSSSLNTDAGRRSFFNNVSNQGG